MVRRKNSQAQRHADSLKRNEEKTASGLVSEKFPNVSGMVIKMTYYQETHDPVLMVRTINVYPTSPAFFRMNCAVKECDNGGFDLTSTIKKLVKGRKKSATGQMECCGSSGKKNSKHASISYEIDIKYKKASR